LVENNVKLASPIVFSIFNQLGKPFYYKRKGRKKETEEETKEEKRIYERF
jgi:hypothetical protein